MAIIAIINGIECDSSKDKRFSINLPFGGLYKNDKTYYILGNKPCSDSTAAEKKEEIFSVWDDEQEKIVEKKREVLEWISLLSPDELIYLFVETIRNSAVIIKDAEFYLKTPIITTGIAKVYIDNCKSYGDETTEGFIDCFGAQSGEAYKDGDDVKEFLDKLEEVVKKSSIISRNVITYRYKKYGSQYLHRDTWPKTHTTIQIGDQDSIIPAKIDERGYPSSAGMKNKHKPCLIVVRG